MKRQTKSLPARIRQLEADFKLWMARRQQNFLHARSPEQKTAEDECVRIANALDILRAEQARVMAATEKGLS